MNRGETPFMAYEEISRAPPPASATTNPCCDGFLKGEKHSTQSLTFLGRVTDRKDVVRETIQHTGVETCLALGHESDSGFAFVSVGYETSIYRRSAHLALLSSLPSVRMRQDELKVVLNGFPYGGTTSVAVDDEGPDAAEEILEKIAKHLHRRF